MNPSKRRLINLDLDWEPDDEVGEETPGVLDDEGMLGISASISSPDPGTFAVTLRTATFDGQDCVELHAHGQVLSNAGDKKVDKVELLARVTVRELTMYPLVAASYRLEFLEPKYDELTEIVIVADDNLPWTLPKTVDEFDGLLRGLPTGFGRYARYGLGLKWEYRLIPEAILEHVGVTRLVIEPGDGAVAQLPEFRLGIDRFNTIRKAIDAISDGATRRSLRDRRLAAYNGTLNAALPDQFERRLPEIKPGEIYELVQLRGHNSARSAKDSLAAARVVREGAEQIAAEEPAELLRLMSVLEQVTLKELIGKLESMLSRNLAEPKWQSFFKNNPFILSLAFAHPVILFQDQASVGGNTIRGNGGSIADFLMAQRFTGNLALVEIKRPSSGLVGARPYRGDLYAPHTELTASIAQVLDQRTQLLHHFSAKKSSDRMMADTEVSAVQCIVIIGTLPTDMAQQRSLDLFRYASKDVVVVTFDELLEKLKVLHGLMSMEHAAKFDVRSSAEAPAETTET